MIQKKVAQIGLMVFGFVFLMLAGVSELKPHVILACGMICGYIAGSFSLKPFDKAKQPEI